MSTVLDGDTVVLETGESLRLRGIDAPEVRHKASPGQYYAKESTSALRELVQGRVLLLDKSELDTDRYGRLVGLAKFDDGRIVNLLMIQDGAAFVYSHPSDRDKDMAGRLLSAQISAMNRGKGFWPKILGASFASNPYTGNMNSKRFHSAACSTGSRITKSNRVYFSSLREAFASGYAPARECTPWPQGNIVQ